MACYTGFGNLADGRPIWVGDFSGSGTTDVLFYFPGDSNWWLGKFVNNSISWNLAGNTAGFGNIADGRPIWVGDFSGGGTTDLLFYFPGDGNWLLGKFINNTLQWNLAGNTLGVNPPQPFPVQCNNIKAVIASLKSQIIGFQQQLQGAAPGQKAFLINQINKLNQQKAKKEQELALCLAQYQQPALPQNPNFGQIADGRPIWVGDFSGGGTIDVLFYYPGDGNWWLGKFVNNSISWNLAGNTIGFGNIADGRPIWVGDFSGSGTTDVLFYFPGDSNWWLGKFVNNSISWNLAGNTAGFGNIADGRPIWVGDFSGGGTTDVLFYYPGDGNWWLGKFVNNSISWNLSGNTGRPYTQILNVHFKSLLVINNAINTFIDTQFNEMETLFLDGGVLAIRGTTEDLSVNMQLQPLQNLNVGQCLLGQPTQDQNTLFQNRNNAGVNDLVVYIVNTLIGGAGNFVGCATHPNGQPGCAIVQINANWLLSHEIGHVLGLPHVATTPSTNSDFLMWPNISWTNTPPIISNNEYNTMLKSNLTSNC